MKDVCNLTESNIFVFTFFNNYIQQDPQTRFLYQIIENKDNGIDVNKFDYLTRDAYYTGVGHSFSFKRIISDMLVFDTHRGSKEICFRDTVN